MIERGLLRKPGESLTAHDVDEALREITPLTEQDVIRRADLAIATNAPDRFATKEKRERYLMGKLMRDLIGRVEGATVRELLHARLALPGRGDPPEIEVISKLSRQVTKQ